MTFNSIVKMYTHRTPKPEKRDNNTYWGMPKKERKNLVHSLAEDKSRER